MTMGNVFRFVYIGVFVTVSHAALYMWSEKIIIKGFDNIALVNAEKANETVTTLFTHSVITPFVEEYGEQSISVPLASFDYALLHAKVIEFFNETPAKKLKLISSDGVIVYSTDPNDLGEDYSQSDKVIRALRGMASTQRDFEEEIIGVTGAERDVWLMSSYVPIYDVKGEPIGVVEIYSNYTSAYNYLQGETDQARSALIMSFGLINIIIIAGLWLTMQNSRKVDLKS